MTNSHKFDKVCGYRDTAAGSNQICLDQAASSQPMSNRGSAIYRRRNKPNSSVQTARRGYWRTSWELEQPLTYEVPYGDPSPGLRRWRYWCANRLGDDSLSACCPAWRASNSTLIRRYRPSPRLGSWHFPVMHWEFAKRAVNTSVVD